MTSDLRDLIARVKVDRQDAERHGYGCTEVGNSELTALLTAAEASLSAADRIEADRKRIEELESEMSGWRECALYDATMNGPVFKGWDRSALDRVRRRALEGVTNG